MSPGLDDPMPGVAKWLEFVLIDMDAFNSATVHENERYSALAYKIGLDTDRVVCARCEPVGGSGLLRTPRFF